MEVHDDNEYYKARAKDVKLGDITSDGWNADILASLRDNDSVVGYISITTSHDDVGDFVVREGDDLGWLGYFVGRSKQLETLFIDSFPENINIDAFVRGLGHNRSIQTLEIGIDLGERFRSLFPFMRNNDSLRVLNFFGFDIGMQCARNIALLLGQQSSLKRLEFDETDLDDERFTQIVTALRSQPRIEELVLYGSYNISRDGYTALGNTLEGCSSLRKLVFVFSNHDHDDIGDERLRALAAGLRSCHNLTSLRLFGSGNLMMTEEGSRSLSSLFQSDNCRLETLYLTHMNIGNDEMAILATRLARLPSLKRLNLQGASIGEQGLQALVGALVNCNLEVLDLSNNINMLGESVSGLRSLGALVRRSTSMQSLTLSDSSITDEGLQCFVEGMASCCSLTFLCLSYNRSITANGLVSLSSLFQAEHCSLCTLSLYGIRLNDDGAAVLSNGLIGNKSLKNLYIDHDISGITSRGWAAFSRLLCDTSSVNNTYLSNHTLARLATFNGFHSSTPQDIVHYLQWNKSDNQAAAICKILDSHPDIDATPLLQWKMKFLPLVVAWLEKVEGYLSTDSFQCRQISAVYKFVRGMPQLVVDGYRRQNANDIQLNAKKRKFDLTL
eukprot:scaffold2288_cov131-Skeletonema_menzelii.AAC.5